MLPNLETRGRISFDEMYSWICYIIAERSTCLRRKTGCLIVQDGQVVAMGYNGAPKGLPHCSSMGCLNDAAGPRASQGEVCRGVHAEQNAVVQAGVDKCRGATLYVNAAPCQPCAKLIIQAEVGRVVISGDQNGFEGASLLRQSGVEVVVLDLPDALRHRPAAHA